MGAQPSCEKYTRDLGERGHSAQWLTSRRPVVTARGRDSRCEFANSAPFSLNMRSVCLLS